MCQFGMQTVGDDGQTGMVAKLIPFITNSRCIASRLDRKCLCGHSHVPLLGGRAAAAAVYPIKFPDAICEGLTEQLSEDAQPEVVVCNMNIAGCSMTRQLDDTTRIYIRVAWLSHAWLQVDCQ